MSKNKRKKQTKRKTKNQGKKCFVVSAIDSAGSPTRDRADTVFKEIIQPALDTHAASFKVERIDRKGGAGNITEGVIENLRTADLVVVDLTDLNPNVMYEMGIRQAWDLPLIPIISADQLDSLPFDVKVLNTVPYSLKNKKSKQAAIIGIRKQLKSILLDDRMNTLFKKAMSLVGKDFSMDSVFKSFHDALTDTYRATFDFKHELPHTLELGVTDPQTIVSFAGALRRIFERLSDKLYVFEQIARGRPGEHAHDTLLSLIRKTHKVLEKANAADRFLTKSKLTTTTRVEVEQQLDSAIEIIDEIAGEFPNREK